MSTARRRAGPAAAMHPQRAAAAVFLAVSVAYLALALRIEEVQASPAATIGPRGFPLLIGAIGALVSLLLLVAPPAAAAVAASEAHSTSASRAGGVFAGDWRRALALCGLTLLYAWALPTLGFTLATVGFLAASFRLLGERRPVPLIVVPVAVALALFVLLRGALGAYLPEPLFEGLLARLGPAG